MEITKIRLIYLRIKLIYGKVFKEKSFNNNQKKNVYTLFITSNIKLRHWY